MGLPDTQIVVDTFADFLIPIRVRVPNAETGVPEPLDITGYTVEAKMRDVAGYTYIPGGVMSFTGSVVEGEAGLLQITLTDTQTQTLIPNDNATQDRWPKWDCLITSPGGFTSKVGRGSVKINTTQTR